MPPTRRGYAAACVAAAAAGFASAVQTGVNVSLAETVRDEARVAATTFASLVSISGGLGLLLAVNAIDSAVASSARWNARRLRPRDVIGGFLGSGAQVLMLFAAKRVGLGLTATSRMAGMLFVSLILDHRGACGYERRPCTLRRGVALARTQVHCLGGLAIHNLSFVLR